MKPKESVLRRIRQIFVQVVFYIFLALIVLSAVFLFIRGRQSEPTFVLGRTYLWVKTGSMKPTIDERSYVLVREADGEAYEVGDVIVFPCPDPESPVYGSLIIHRVVEVTDDGYHTKGDSKMSVMDPWTVAPDSVVAEWECNLVFLTFVGRFFASPSGFVILCAAFFALCAFVYFPSILKTMREDCEKEADDEYKAELERRISLEVERLERENKKE